MKRLPFSQPFDPRPKLSLGINQSGWDDDMPDHNWEATMFVYVKLGKQWYPLDAQSDGSDISLCLSGVGISDVEMFMRQLSSDAAQGGFVLEYDEDFWDDLAKELHIDRPATNLEFKALRNQFAT